MSTRPALPCAQSARCARVRCGLAPVRRVAAANARRRDSLPFYQRPRAAQREAAPLFALPHSCLPPAPFAASYAARLPLSRSPRTEPRTRTPNNGPGRYWGPGGARDRSSHSPPLRTPAPPSERVALRACVNRAPIPSPPRSRVALSLSLSLTPCCYRIYEHRTALRLAVAVCEHTPLAEDATGTYI